MVVTDFYVYIHRRATDNKVFYVGKGHAGRAWSSKGRNKYWHKIVGKHGFIVEIALTGIQEWYTLEREIELIAKFRAFGFELANVTDGGDGVSGLKFTAASRKRMSDTHKARYASNPELRAKISARMTNMPAEEKAEMLCKASEAIKSPDVRKKLSEASKAMWGAAEFREKHSAAMSEVRANPVYMDKHREATKAAKLRPEARKRQSDLMTSLMSDPNRRAQIGQAVKLAYQSEDVKARHKEATAVAVSRVEAQAKYRAAMASPEVRAKISAAQEHKLVPVVCVETRAVFSSALVAEQWLKEGGHTHAQHNAIRGACKGKRKTAYGFHWNYA